MLDNLLAPLAAGATVVTPTRRLAQAVRSGYDLAQQAAGRSAWPSPDVLSWSAWQQREWQAAQFVSPLPLLLDAQQELALWERVIRASPEAARLLHVEAAASEARDAWAALCAYRLSAALDQMPSTDETQAFLAWRDAFLQFCTREHLIDPARLPDELAHQFAAGNLRAPQRLILFGFDTVDPQRAALGDVLRSRGSQVEALAPASAPGHASVSVHPGPEQEIRASAVRAREILQRSPHARIGIVVPDLGPQRATMARIFDDVLLPDAVLSPGRMRARPWNLSLGEPLSDWPVVHAALLVLELAQGKLPAARTGMLLRSPFLGDAETERMSRALLDARLCDLREPYVDLDTLEYEARRENRLHASPLLLQRLWQLRRRTRDAMHQRQPPSAWGPYLQSLLVAMGWPGQRTLDSEEHQAVEAWRELIADLARFDLILGAIGHASAVQLVRRLASERLFQPETPDVPVQILGVLESAGLRFDHLMVLGLHGEAWPRPARPNSLLPVNLQRRAGVPRGCAEWELQFARRMMTGWLHAAPDVVFSHAAAEEDRMLRASPLLMRFPRAAAASDVDDYSRLVAASRSLETLEDIVVQPLQPGMRASGGASVFRDQAACPFRAFAAHRLGASQVEHPTEGLDASERGTLVHAALAHFWSAVRDHAGLNAGNVEEQVREAVDRALAQFAPRRRSLFQSRFIDLERERLAGVLLEWLEVDRRRPPFAVLPPEQAQDVEIGGLRLRVRLDRVDRLPDGREVLIDYKTGEAATRHWLGERPDEPQLPAYAVARTQRPAGLAFAIVKRGKCRLHGLAEDAEIGKGIDSLEAARIDGKADDWPAQVAAWAATLDALGAQFRGTAVRVDPKRYPQTCRTCSFASLCRVGELLGSSDAVPGGED
jgi:ATP-dependent helicase/nuclease subunit B